MPVVAKIEIVSWLPPSECALSEQNDLKVGDYVVFKTDAGIDAGKIVSIAEVSELSDKESEISSILRKATTEDINIISEQEKQKAEALNFCKLAVANHNVPMKVIDVHFSFDGGRLVFPFIADGRVDFRDLVKDLTHHFQKSIRLQQIGIRDEAKISGDLGSCGRRICCRTFLRELGSITSEFADLQQVSHRGSERLTGLCGRLRCCLAYEKEMYQKLSELMPAVGTSVKTPQGKGEVVGLNILRQTVSVSLSGKERNIMEFPLQQVKKD